MNPEAQEVLKRILAKDVNTLTEFDRGFLRARRAYIGKNSRAKFASVLDAKQETPKEDKKEKEKKEQPTATPQTTEPTSTHPADAPKDDDGEDEV